MTLILTRVARDGIVMAADSALTEKFGELAPRILHGVTKLMPHQASASCIGTWGGGVVPHPEPKKAPIAIEFVVKTFLKQAGSISSGLELVERLADWLGENYCADRDFIGLDISTVRPEPGIELPAVYRLTNAETPDKKPRRFFHHRVLRAPVLYDADVDQIIIPAGDENNAGVWVEEFHTAARHAVERTGSDPLPDEIDGLSSWLPSIVRAVSDAYQSLEIGESIGGRVTSVAMRLSDGCISARST
jgi:hypothetical protein